MSKFLTEFKEFAMKGNVIDMAVGVIVGGAFGKIVSSLVDNVIMPVIGWMIGGINFSDLKYVITEATETDPEASIGYGLFIQNCVDFLIIAFSIFLAIKAVTKLSRKKEEAPAPEAPAEPSAEEKLLTEIRDLLKKD